MSPSPSLPDLPAELQLQIFEEVLTFPDGLDSDRWHFDRANQWRFVFHKNRPLDEPRTYVQQLSLLHRNIPTPLIQESLYKSNKVVIRPRTSRPDGTTINGPRVQGYAGHWWSTIRPYITYPTVAQSQFVRHLEFHVDLSGAGNFPLYYVDDQMHWIKRLSSGELGFPNLETLRFVFEGANRKEHIKLLTAPLYFATKEVEVVVNGRSCASPSECTHANCFLHRRNCMMSCWPRFTFACDLCWLLSNNLLPNAQGQ